MSDLKEKSSPAKWDIETLWQLNYFCNFNCPYCTLPHRKNPRYMGGRDVGAIAKAFDGTGLIWLIGPTGGEPFLYPNFVELCRLLTRKHYIYLTSNISTDNVYDFCEKIDPARVRYIYTTVHITERERLGLKEDFIKKVKALKRAGFVVYVRQVTWPPVLKNYKEMFSEFVEHGIITRPKIFKGCYDNKQYPGAYTEDEKQVILSFSERADELEKHEYGERFVALDHNEELVRGFFSFKGLPCAAGRRVVWTKYNGDVIRCLDDNRCLGNIYKNNLKLMKGDESCRGKICFCTNLGVTYATGRPTIVPADGLQDDSVIGKMKRALRHSGEKCISMLIPERYR